MKNPDFIHEVIKLYRSARYVRPFNLKISRGRSRSISSLLEDSFAAFLEKRVKCSNIYIDQPISIPGHRQPKYPDISVVRNDKIVAFCDLKTDMGWHRDSLLPLCRHHYRWLRMVRGKTAKSRDGITKKELNIKIGKRATYSVVILNEHNINPEKLKYQIGAVRRKYRPNIDVFILTKGGHPNDYETGLRKLHGKITMRQPDVRDLICKLNKS